jgi:activated CDC42 kinase 1
MSEGEESSTWLVELLAEVQLDSFYVKLRDNLQVTRLAHFDYVKTEDLERIGMSKPAIRRLLDAVKRRKNRGKKGLLDKVRLSSFDIALLYLI